MVLTLYRKAFVIVKPTHKARTCKGEAHERQECFFKLTIRHRLEVLSLEIDMVIIYLVFPKA